MLSKGADLDDDEVDVVVDYLAKNFGPTKASAGGEKKHNLVGSVNAKVTASRF
jgi:hypothetical protein